MGGHIIIMLMLALIVKWNGGDLNATLNVIQTYMLFVILSVLDRRNGGTQNGIKESGKQK